MNGRDKCTHIKFLTEWHNKTVKLVTTTLEDDTENNMVETTNTTVGIQVGEVNEEKMEKLARIKETFGDVLCDEPGVTDLVELEIDTHNSPPVYQSAYNTPVAVQEKVTEEINWLRDRGYIRKSNSPWASLIVTVRKPRGAIRLCIDYK